MIGIPHDMVRLSSKDRRLNPSGKISDYGLEEGDTIQVSRIQAGCWDCSSSLEFHVKYQMKSMIKDFLIIPGECCKKYQSVANICMECCSSSYGISSSSVWKHELYVNILEYNILLKLSISRVQLTSVWMFKQRYVTRYLLRKRFNTADLYL